MSTGKKTYEKKPVVGRTTSSDIIEGDLIYDKATGVCYMIHGVHVSKGILECKVLGHHYSYNSFIVGISINAVYTENTYYTSDKEIDGEIVKVQEYGHRYAVYERVI